ncbi:cobalt-precorrin-6Y C(15)-methyltransferase [Desulfosporosinus acididurans]|uniref:Cobalt-precorrin-6Y C(15)-methyltransferase n=1 Tax=Desulfosporosinus acididurans TaxID=476652 RepID=A0A0J1FN53_9FIRM|nr:class I SAM-dependent methyltransferase [Desulfosporosinus acididurans]KLU64939.1 cobalt-precorrin-6Y C(15)-methyltransferase [Desulfosporosinus acididurans]
MFKNVVELAKQICQLKLRQGDKAADCTMGNGNDTAFLCGLVGEEGKVYAFDIQEEAIINTREKLGQLKLQDRAVLIRDGHETIDSYIKEPIRLFMFNLGYLPKGDHEITTKKDTTLQAVQKCLDLLEPDGLILLVIYPGHERGKEEKEALAAFAATLNQKTFNVAHIRLTNQVNDPPELLCIEKVLPR